MMPSDNVHEQELHKQVDGQDSYADLHSPLARGQTYAWPRMRHASEIVFPFLKLQKKKEVRDSGFIAGVSARAGRSEEEIFFVLVVAYIGTIIMFIYMLLTISCWHFEMHEGEVRVEGLIPKVGNHYAVVVFVKEIVQVGVLHHLCGALMEPHVELHEHRTDPCNTFDENGREISLLDETYGVVRFLLDGVRYSLFRLRKLFTSGELRRPEKTWLSTFVADHILLFGVGTGAICHQISLLWLKYRGHKYQKQQEIAEYLGLNWTMDILLALACIHMAIQVMGFLYTTLESNVVPKKDRKKEFGLFMSLFIFLWMVDFLAIVLDRQVFTASFQSPVNYAHRIFAAIAQIFVSHSTVMLGAVLMGHSCHFMKSPDMEWKVFLSKGVPFVLLFGLYVFGVQQRRLHHSDLSCRSGLEKAFAEAWPYIDLGLDASSGIMLLGLAFWNCQNGKHTELENGELMKVFDYDKALVSFTFAASILYSINQIFYAWGMRLGWSWAAAIVGLTGPIGLAIFTLSVWRWPPRIKSGGRQGWILGIALWLALFTAATQFVDFQDKEDCEICSDLPGCCNYPFLPDWNDKEDKWRTCDRAVRCSEAHWSPELNQTMYCVLPEHHDEDTQAIRRPLMTDSGSLFQSKFSPEYCAELKARWADFIEDRAALEAEVEEEEESMATTFRLFNLLGQAASVEMYFTIFGVLLKVIFRTWHKHSEAILDLGHHQHHEDHHGNHLTISVGRYGASRSAVHDGLSGALFPQAGHGSHSIGTGISLE